MKIKIFLITAILVLAVTGCNNYTYVDGEYTAIYDDFNSFGYKAFIVISLTGDVINEVDFDYIDSDQNLLSNDQAYQEIMYDSLNIGPAQFLIAIESQCANASIVPTLTPIDGISGATNSTADANRLFEAALNIAKEGDTDKIILPL